ncbi:TIGR01458 family HAD-type hydrolase [Roseiconus nitratireducens]|uniref:TIGR01458 family HAD-type hydrolase n=1 Tax=Roseiconus nitratireducens TaxID=2605748 RepID=UPI001375AD13|nr:TIGR01458 family HAD-type hydrolase [Roseiconus nitratireducens]
MIDRPYDACLIDIAGVIHTGGRAIAGSVQAIGRLQASGMPFRLLTNTTSKSSGMVLAMLTELGVDVSAEDLLTAPKATIEYLKQNDLRPHLLIADALEEDFQTSGLELQSPNCVVLGDAGEKFTYPSLNQAFRLLQSDDQRPLIAMGGNRYFREADGDLSLDIFPFAALLSEAASREVVITGKPSAEFFAAAVGSLGTERERTVMIGDDLESDVGGALNAGIDGILVRTGKFDPAEFDRSAIQPTAVHEDLASAVDEILP